MCHEDDWPADAGAPQPGHEIALFRRRFENLHIGFWQSSGAKPRDHCIGGLRGIARGGDGVDFNKLALDVPGELLVGEQWLGRRSWCGSLGDGESGQG
jgi:hypothetical protein